MSTVHFFCAICGTALRLPANTRCPVTECTACHHSVPVPSPIELPDGIGVIEDLPAVFPSGVLALEVKFLCASCSARLQIDARWEGYEIVCPQCREAITVPRWSRRAAPPPAVRLSAPEVEFLSEPFTAAARTNEV